MFGGFDPRLQALFLRRRRGRALVLAVLVTGAVTAISWWVAPPPAEDAVDVVLEPEISDFAIEEEAEPEIEEEPPPPPPPDAKVKVVETPKPRPRPKPPDKKVEGGADESSDDKAHEVGPGGATGNGDGPRSDPPAAKPRPEPNKPEPAPRPAPKPAAKKKPTIDPTQPIDRPENASAPVPDAGNAKPVYPPELRDAGITGSVLVKLHVHRDGTVRAAKVLRKTNNATTEDDRANADKLLLKAVIAAVQTWRYTPAKLDGQPITVWHKVNIPFSLKAD